jgi:copper ion binding protein
MEKVTYNVPSINCMHCVHTISTELGELEGVKSVVADAEKKMVVVEFVPPATAEKIKNQLAEINYPVAQ